MSHSSGSLSDFENPSRYDYGSDFEIESDDSTEYDNLRRRLARDDITDDIDDVITARDDDDDDLSDVDVLAELAGRGSGSSDNNNEAGQDDVTSNIMDDNHDGSDTSGLGTTYTITDDRSPVVLLGDSSNASPINGAFIFPPESGVADDSCIFPPESRAADDSSGLRAREDRMSRLVPSPPRSPRDRRDYREYSPRRYRVRSPDSRSSSPAAGPEHTASPGPVSPVSPEITHRPRRPVPDQPFVTSGYLSHFVLDTVPSWRENSQPDTDSSFLGNYSWRASSPTNWRRGTNLSPDTTSQPLDSSDTSSNNRQIHRLSISDVGNNGSDVTSEGGSHEPGEVATVPCLICDSDSNSGSDWDVSYNDVIPPDNADHDNVTNVETFTDVTPLGDTLADVDDLQQTLADDATDSPFDVILRSSVDAGASDNEEPDSHVPNILLPSEAPDDDVTYSDDVMIVAQMIDLANSLELPDSGRDAPLMEMSGGDSEGIDTEQHGDLESHTERRLRLIRQATSESGPGERGDADGGDDVDEESTPIPASRSRRQGWAGGAETNTLLRDTSLEFGGNAEEQTTLTMMSRLAAQLQPLTPTVVSSNTSAAAPPCPRSDPDEHITFEQLMNMDSTALGELADDERGDLELDEFVAQWAGDERDLLDSLMRPPTPPRRRVDSPEPEIPPSLTGILRRRGSSPEPDVSYTRTGRPGILVPRVRGGSPEAHIRRRRRGSMDRDLNRRGSLERHIARRSPVSSVSPVSSLDTSDSEDDLRDLLTPAALERRRAASVPSPQPNVSHRRSMDRDFNRRGSVERHVADRGTPENYLACISRMRADSPETPPRPRYTGSVDRDLNLECHVADRSGILVPRVRGGSPEAHIRRRRRGSMDRDLNRRGSLERHRADSLEVIADRASPEASARPRVNPASYQHHIGTRGHHLTDSESEDDEMEGNRPGSMGEEEWRQVMDVIRADRRAERLRNREARRIQWRDLGRADPPPDAPGGRGVRYNHYADDDGDVWETESSSEETTAHALPGAPPTYAQLSAVPGTPRRGSRVVSTNLPGGPGDTAGGPGQASPGVGEAGQADRGSVFGLFETSNPGAARTSTGGDDDEAPPDYETLFTPPEYTTVEPPAYTSLQFQRVSVRPHTPGRAELIHQLRQLRVRRCELIYQQGELRITDTLFTDTDMTLYARSMRSVQGHLHTWYMTAGTCSGEKTVNLMKHNHPLRTDPLYPGCICADTKRKLIAYTTSDSIVLAKPCGKVKDVIKNSHDKKHEFRQLSGIDYCYSADLYVVTDVSLHRVLLVKPKTRKVYKTFGEHGTGAAQFDNPTLVRCSTHNDIVTLVVLDVGNNAVKLFNTEGQPLHTWGQCAQPEGRLLEPSGLCVGRRGEVYVAEAGRRRVVMYWTERGQHCAQTLMRGGDLAGEHPLSISYVPGADCDKLVIVTSETYPPTAADFNKLNIFKIKQGESPSLEGVTDD